MGVTNGTVAVSIVMDGKDRGLSVVDQGEKRLDGLKRSGDGAARSLDGVGSSSSKARGNLVLLKGGVEDVVETGERLDGFKNKWMMLLGVVEFVAPAIAAIGTAVGALVELLDERNEVLEGMATTFWEAEDAAYDLRDAVYDLGNRSEQAAGKMVALRSGIASTAVLLARLEGDVESVNLFQNVGTSLGLQAQLEEAQRVRREAERRRSEAEFRIEQGRIGRMQAFLPAEQAADEAARLQQELNKSADEWELMSDAAEGYAAQAQILAVTVFDPQIKTAEKARAEADKTIKLVDVHIEQLEEAIQKIDELGSKPLPPLPRPERETQPRPTRRKQKTPEIELGAANDNELGLGLLLGEKGFGEGPDLGEMTRQMREELERARAEVLEFAAVLQDALAPAMSEVAGMVGQLGSVWGDYAAEQLDAGQAALKSADIIVTGIGKQYLAEEDLMALLAVKELGLGIAMSFINPAEAASHFLAAAVLGAGAIAGYASGGGGGARGRERQSPRSARATDLGGGGQGAINLYLMAPIFGTSVQELGDYLGNALDATRGTGFGYQEAA